MLLSLVILWAGFGIWPLLLLLIRETICVLLKYIYKHDKLHFIKKKKKEKNMFDLVLQNSVLHSVTFDKFAALEIWHLIPIKQNKIIC